MAWVGRVRFYAQRLTPAAPNTVRLTQIGHVWVHSSRTKYGQGHVDWSGGFTPLAPNTVKATQIGQMGQRHVHQNGS